MSGFARAARFPPSINDLCLREAGHRSPPVGRPHDGLDGGRLGFIARRGRPAANLRSSLCKVRRIRSLVPMPAR